ncbi:hypothetical protein MCAMS1_02803 [biofilm metagenome]
MLDINGLKHTKRSKLMNLMAHILNYLQLNNSQTLRTLTGQMIFAGIPTAVLPEGTSCKTTALAPMMA